MELVRLRKEDVKEFKQLMIDAFQCGLNLYMVKVKNKL